MRNIIAGGLLAATLLAGGVMAQGGPNALVIGPTRVLMVRQGDTLNGRPQSPQDRIAHVHDIFAKHLGGKYAKFTTKGWGDRVHIYINGDFVLAATPADAKANGYKTSAQLAAVWTEALKKAFDAAHVEGKGGAS
jgi:hypothetical protein